MQSKDSDPSIEGAKKVHKLRDDPTNWWLIAYFLIGTILFGWMAYPLAKYFSFFFWDLNTQLPLVDNIYYRYYVHTEYVPFQQLAYYGVMMILGFMFINIVNL